MEICSYGHPFKYLSKVTNITSKSYVHPSIFFKLIFQCSHKSFVIFIYAFEYLIFPPVIIPLDLLISATDKEKKKDILIYHFPCPRCWDVGNLSYEHQFDTSENTYKNICIPTISI